MHVEILITISNSNYLTKRENISKLVKKRPKTAENPGDSNIRKKKKNLKIILFNLYDRSRFYVVRRPGYKVSQLSYNPRNSDIIS